MTQVIHADELTSNYGSEHCKRLRRHIFSDLSPIAGDLALHYVKIAERTSFEQANHKLQDIHEQLRIKDLNLALTLKNYALLPNAMRKNATRSAIAKKPKQKRIKPA